MKLGVEMDNLLIVPLISTLIGFSLVYGVREILERYQRYKDKIYNELSVVIDIGRSLRNLDDNAKIRVLEYHLGRLTK